MFEAIERGWENFVGRLYGPMQLRLIIEPAIAMIFAVLSGLKDARAGRKPMLWALLLSREDRARLLREGWKDLSITLMVAIGADCIYQVMTQKAIYLLELIATVSMLAIIPYVIIRTLIGLLARRFYPRPKANEASSDAAAEK
jgi:hypothetical protein